MDVKTLLAQQMIRETQYRYGHAIDYGENHEWVDCFTEDGIFEMNPMRNPRMLDGFAYGEPHPGGLRVTGRDELLEFIKRHSNAPTVYHKHMVLNSIIVIEDDEHARSETYFQLLWETSDGPPFIRAMGRYLDELVLGLNDRWRFKKRTSEIESMG